MYLYYYPHFGQFLEHFWVYDDIYDCSYIYLFERLELILEPRTKLVEVHCIGQLIMVM